MLIYAKYVLPRFIDLSIRNKETARVRADWVPHARGDVLEVGIGSGLNLPLYSAEVRRVYGMEPSAELQKMARKRMASQAIKVEFLSQSATFCQPKKGGSNPSQYAQAFAVLAELRKANYAAVSVVA
jgi:hypothetical protein